jgi:hypothetical protein
MALYEAIRKGQSKRSGRKKTVRFRPFAPDRRASATRKKEVGYYQRIEDGAAKGKLAALWTPRVNLALPYPVVVCLLVAGAALLVAAFRFGQLKYDAGWLFFEPVVVSEPASDKLLDSEKLLDSSFMDLEKDDLTTGTDNETVENDNIEDTSAGQNQGTNAIVIQVFSKRKDLEYVQEYFEKKGIKTEIVEGNGMFRLRTTQLYHKCSVDRNSFNPDYDGDVARKEIGIIGAKYKAPPGYDGFRTNLFRDAYGEKVK